MREFALMPIAGICMYVVTVLTLILDPFVPAGLVQKRIKK